MRNFLLVFVFVASHLQATGSIQWLAVSRVSLLGLDSMPPSRLSSMCDQFRGSLVRKQIRFCKDHLPFMDSVRLGAIRAIDECQFQFRTRRWNCSTLNDEAIAAVRKRFLKHKPQDLVVISNKTERAATRISSRMMPAPGHYYNVSKAEASTSSNSSSSASSSSQSSSSSSSASSSSSSSPSSSSNSVPSSSNISSFSSSSSSRQDNQKRKRKRKRKKGRRGKKKNSHKKLSGLVGPYPIVPQGTREAAFVHAISSAGVAYAITRRCSSGQLDDCGCDRSVRGVTEQGFQWSGCSDNIAYGTSLSKRFVDARDLKLARRKGRSRSRRALMNLHNNEAGRKLIERNMRVECKCHGVSGSCELKTCWKAMPTFREIGEILKEKFDGATEIEVRTVNGRPQLVPHKVHFKPHTDTDLVYVQQSPEYCEYDINEGSLGTEGRRCNKTSRAIDGCDLLCCNRGYTTHRERVIERCSCKFHWCCYVQCRTCVRDVEVHTCK